MALFISSTDNSFLIHWVRRKCNETFYFQKDCSSSGLLQD